MSEQDSTPRRALPPREDPDDLPGSAPRYQAWAARPGEGDATSGTPVPPPAVLPTSRVAPAAAGRRFSADELLEDPDDRPLPRRSAVTPGSPSSPDAPPAAADDASPARSRRPWLWPLLALLVVGALVAGYLVMREATPEAPVAPSTPTPTPVDPVATYLLQPAELAGAREGVTWRAVDTATKIEPSTPQAVCLGSAREVEPAPASSVVRTFAPEGEAPGGVLQQVDTYGSPEEASTALTARLQQLGSCPRTTGLITSGLALTGLADAASGVTFEVQSEKPEFHTIVVARTGKHVTILDATRPDAVPDPARVAPLLAVPLARQCTEGGTCPTTPAVAAATPPASTPLGWLTPADLPRITKGAGAWRGTEPGPVTAVGSRCEAVDLTKVDGASSIAQRTYLLRDDAATPQGFGLDEIVYTFATPEAAKAFAGTLSGNIDGCANRTATAQVARTATLEAPLAGGAWVVTQKVNKDNATARFRVGVATQGNRVVHLSANPSDTFDFSDAAWQAALKRAGERLAQMA